MPTLEISPASAGLSDYKEVVYTRISNIPTFSRVIFPIETVVGIDHLDFPSLAVG
jgi:hypothetical protein